VVLVPRIASTTCPSTNSAISRLSSREGCDMGNGITSQAAKTTERPSNAYRLLPVAASLALGSDATGTA
jgi:hypothetical protein